MYKWDEHNKILKVFKIENDVQLGNLLENQVASYNKFKDGPGIETCLDFLCEELRKTLGGDVEITYKYSVGRLVTSRNRRDINGMGEASYPVNVAFSVDGKELPAVKVLDIPYMDDLCVLNVKGKRKVLIGDMIAKEDISFADAGKGLQLVTVLPKRQLTMRKQVYVSSLSLIIKH